LSNKKLSKSQRQLVVEFLDSTFICHTNNQISNLAVSFCLTYNLKPMDSIIVATAKFLNVGFATADKALFKISEVPITRLIISSLILCCQRKTLEQIKIVLKMAGQKEIRDLKYSCNLYIKLLWI
jgi:predicted nucleic acid-binding protein